MHGYPVLGEYALHDFAHCVADAETGAVETQDDCTARLERDERLENSGSDGVRYRHDREHDTCGASNLGHTTICVAADNANAGLACQGLIDAETSMHV